jgi:hypothetical protein
LPMKHHGQTTSDTTSIGISVAAALAGEGIGISSMFRGEDRVSGGKGKHPSGIIEWQFVTSEERRAFAALSKDGRESLACVHPSRRALKRAPQDEVNTVLKLN